MVQRSGAVFELPGNAPTQFQQSSAGVAQIDQQAVANAAQGGALRQIASELFGVVAKVDLAHDEVQRQEAYLSGAEQFSKGLSEEALEADPMTRNWTIAGYRDTQGRLGLADMQADIAANMKKYREMSPEDFSKVMAEKRKELQPILSSMSRDARKRMSGQLVTGITSLTAAHAKEHAKFIIEQKTRALQTSMSVNIDAMNAAKDSGVAYAEAAGNVLAGLYENVVQDPDLPDDLKQKLIEEAMEYSLATDNLALYEAAKNTTMPMPGGRSGRITDYLPMDKQASLAAKYREAGARTDIYRNMQYTNELSAVNASLNDPNSQFPTPQEYQLLLDMGVKNKTIKSLSQYEGYWDQYNAATLKRDRSTNLGKMYAAGDLTGMLKNGGIKEGQKAFELAALNNGATMSDLAIAYAAHGRTTGIQQSFERVGELITPALAAVGESEEATPDNDALLQTTFRALEEAEAAGSTGAFQAMISTLPEDLRLKAVRMRSRMRNSAESPHQAAAAAQKQRLDEQAMSPELKRALYQQAAKDSADILKEVALEGGGRWKATRWISGAAGWAGDLFASKDSEYRGIENQLQPSTGWFGDEAADAQKDALAQAYTLELSDLADTQPSLTKDQRRTLAGANILARTIPTEVGALILPKGTDPNTFFGLDADVGRDRLGQALDSLVNLAVPEAKGVQWGSDPDGSVRFRPFRDGKPIAGTPWVYLDREAVKGQVDAMREADATAGAKLIRRGSVGGTSVSKGGGGTVRYDGENTVGVSLDLMHRFRQNLIASEGVQNKVYSDLSNKDRPEGRKVLTFGAGISSTNPAFPKGLKEGDIVDEETASNAFAKASDGAMATAYRLLQNSAKLSENWLLFMGEWAYQGMGTSSKAGVQGVLTAPDFETAAAEFQQSAAWRYAGEARRKQYMNHLAKAFQGE